MAAACPPPVKPPRRQNKTVQKGTDPPEVRRGTAPRRPARPATTGRSTPATAPLRIHMIDRTGPSGPRSPWSPHCCESIAIRRTQPGPCPVDLGVSAAVDL